MQPLLQEISTGHTPESLAEQLHGATGLVLLRSGSGSIGMHQARYSFLTARPFLSLRSFGLRSQVRTALGCSEHFGNPWAIIEILLSRCELLDQVDLPFPLGGCFGYWGYELKNFLEPKLLRQAVNDLELPDCHVGFYSSLVVFDHLLNKTWIISTGSQPDGSRDERVARNESAFWRHHLENDSFDTGTSGEAASLPDKGGRAQPNRPSEQTNIGTSQVITHRSNLSRDEFIAHVTQAQRYIRAGDIYQVNLSQRLSATWPFSSWELFSRLGTVSPAPFAAYLDGGNFQVISTSPELFLRISGSHIQTRPIKGTRPRSRDVTRDAQLSYELQTSPKEMAELVMITDLLRNDLGRVCEFGTVHVPELVTLERFAQVQHLVSTVEGHLRSEVTHLAALTACFPGGSITGAPKFRAMEIIDELEPVTRGPYTGALGYLGFNRESQLSIPIRTAVSVSGNAYFHAGAGIVADSDAAAEYQETMDKAQGFVEALQLNPSGNRKLTVRSA